MSFVVICAHTKGVIMATAINPPPSVPSQFFPLPNRQPPVNNASRANNADAAFPSAGFGVLLGIGASPTQNPSSILDVADLISLSPQAQSFLDFFNDAAKGLVGNNALEDNGIVLTDAQQAQITAIIMKFKDAPFSVDTFNAIVSDLSKEVLSPAQLAAKEQVNPFSLSEIFLRALSGEISSSDFPSFNSPADHTSEDAYRTQLFSEWERISSQFDPMVIASFVENPFIRRRNNE